MRLTYIGTAADGYSVYAPHATGVEVRRVGVGRWEASHYDHRPGADPMARIVLSTRYGTRDGAALAGLESDRDNRRHRCEE